MKTEDLISMLANQDAGARPVKGLGRFAEALPLGFAGALALALLLGARADLLEALRLPLFWWKLAFAASLTLAALVACLRLARPGRALGIAGHAIFLPVSAAVIAALAVLALAPRDRWATLVLGETWLVCPWLIALLSVPAFVATIWALRGFAPTRPRLTGAAGGLFSGGLATVAYCIHCPEMEVPFWATWYTLGMLVPTIAGALLGPRLLRW